MTDPIELTSLTDLAPGTFDVERWLNVATRDLCEDAKARVRAEVEAHFTAAYEEVSREGLSEAAASAWALTALGDPEKASRANRRAYLTEGDEKTLAGLNNRGPGGWFTLRFLAVGAVIAAVFQSQFVLLFWLWYTMSMPTFGFVLTPTRLEPLSKLRSLIYVQISVALIQCVSILLAFPMRFDTEIGAFFRPIVIVIFAVGFFSMQVCIVLIWGTLYLKLRRTRVSGLQPR